MANTTGKKFGGRQAGTPNKVTGNLREWITKFIEDNREQVQRDWNSLEPKERVMMFERLLKFALPTLQATSLTASFENMSDEDLDKIIDGLKNHVL